MEDVDFTLPVTAKQMAYARTLALRNQVILPFEVQKDRSRRMTARSVAAQRRCGAASSSASNRVTTGSASPRGCNGLQRRQGR